MKGTIIFLLLVSLFLGYVFGGAVLGNIYPPIFKISAPLVCPNGAVTIETRQHSYQPGSVTTEHKAWCLNGSGESKRDVTFGAVMISCLIFSGVIFLLLLAYTLIKRLKGGQAPGAEVAPQSTPAIMPAMFPGKIEIQKEDPVETLKKLKELRETDLITEEEYQAKKAEILSKM